MKASQTENQSHNVASKLSGSSKGSIHSKAAQAASPRLQSQRVPMVPLTHNVAWRQPGSADIAPKGQSISTPLSTSVQNKPIPAYKRSGSSTFRDIVNSRPWSGASSGSTTSRKNTPGAVLCITSRLAMMVDSCWVTRCRTNCNAHHDSMCKWWISLLLVISPCPEQGAAECSNAQHKPV